MEVLESLRFVDNLVNFDSSLRLLDSFSFHLFLAFSKSSIISDNALLAFIEDLYEVKSSIFSSYFEQISMTSESNLLKCSTLVWFDFNFSEISLNVSFSSSSNLFVSNFSLSFVTIFTRSLYRLLTLGSKPSLLALEFRAKFSAVCFSSPNDSMILGSD